MLQNPLTAEVEFIRPTRIDGAVVPIGAKKTLSYVFATEMVHARKARFTKLPEPPGVTIPVDNSVRGKAYVAPGKEAHNKAKAERKAAAAKGEPSTTGLAVGVEAQAAVQQYGPGAADSLQKYDGGEAVETASEPAKAKK